jgi:hypothetical protein
LSDFRGPKGSIGFGLVLVVASALSAAPAAAQLNEFGSPVAYPAGIGASCAAAADFNRDGVLDLAVVDPDTGTQGVSILLGNGDGSFQAPQTIAFQTNAVCVVAGDFNGDGNPDLAVSQGSDDTVSILLGNGDGTFRAPIAYPVGGTSDGMALGDLNVDGNLDLVVANIAGGANNNGNVAVLLGKGDGTFQPAVNYEAAKGPIVVALGDFNHDGALDMAVVNARSNGSSGNGSVSILMGNGNGTFQAATNYTTGMGPQSIAVADFNGQGNLDLAVLIPGAELEFFKGNGDGTFGGVTTLALDRYAAQVVAADVNDDGVPDLVVPDGQDATIGVLLGHGDGTFQPATDYPAGPDAIYAVVADFNGDGRPDLAVSNGVGNEVSILLNLGAVPSVSLSPTSLSFPTQTIGTTSAVQRVTLTNTGTAALTISSITASGPFVERNGCGSNIPLGASCNINVQFRPLARGPASGSITVTDNAPNSPQTVALTGTGTVVSLAPSSIAFGNLALGQSASATVTVTNLAHNATLTISSITAGSTPPFSQTNNCGSTLGPGASCAVTVTFAPVTSGAFGGSLTLKDNGGGTIQRVPLSGTGT